MEADASTLGETTVSRQGPHGDKLDRAQEHLQALLDHFVPLCWKGSFLGELLLE